MECHKCEHRVAVETGKFRGMVFEETPCARCDGMSSAPYPLQFRDLATTEDRAAIDAGVPELAFPEEVPEPVLPVSVLVSAMALFLALPPQLLAVLRLRYQGMTFVRIAKETGLSVDAVEKRYRRALRRWPALVTLFRQSAAQRR